MSEFRATLRSLLHPRGASATAAVVLALALASATAVFAVADVLLLRSLPFRRSAELVSVGEVNPARKDLYGDISPADFATLRERKDPFESLAAMSPALARLRTQGYVEELSGKAISPDFFGLTGVTPLLGRVISDADAKPGAAPVALLSYSTWRSRFGGAPRALSQTISANDQEYRIVGVLPREVERFDHAAFWIPFSLGEQATNRVAYLQAVGRLRAGVSLPDASKALEPIARNLERAFPETNTGYIFRIRSLRRQLLGDLERPLWALIFAAVVFWLIACANVSNLFLARAASREREIAIRRALGASTAHVVRRSLMEATVLTGGSFLLATPIAVFQLGLIKRMAPPTAWQLEQASIDWRVLLFGVLLAGLTAATFSVIPTAWMVRTLPQEGLSGSKATRSGWSLRKLGGALVGIEAMLALPLLAGAGWIAGSLWNLYHADLGLKPERIYIADLWLFERRFALEESRRSLFRRILESVRQAPEIESAGLVLFNPLPRGPQNGRRFQVDGAPPSPREYWPEATVLETDPAYLAMIGVPLLAGRSLSEQDSISATPLPLVVSRSFALKYLDSAPLGRGLGIQFPSGIEQGIVVGVVGDVAAWPSIEKRPTIYLNLFQHPIQVMTLVVRSRIGVESVAETLRQAVARVDGDLPLRDLRSLRQSLDYGVAEARFVVTLLEAFGALALVLSASGFYSLVTHLVGRRKKEIGIRTALGARPREIVHLFVAELLPWLVSGVAAGLLIALKATNLGRAILPSPTPAPALSPLLAAAIIFISGGLGASIPAIRASRVDPLESLRQT
jgi:putative ABC transport system permease protein